MRSSAAAGEIGAINVTASERKALVVLPTFEERDNVGVMIDAVLAASQHVEILVVDDNSPDFTANEVRGRQVREPRIHLIVRAGKLGLGSAYLLGFKFALENGFDTVVTMDADRSHDPRHLNDIDALHREGYDLVIGSRYAPGGTIHRWNALRKLNSAAANVFARRIVGKQIRDCTSGYRSYSSALLKRIGTLQLESHGYSMLVELLYEAVLAKARISEIPIEFHNRVAGDSKISWREVAESLVTLGRLKLRQIRLARAKRLVETT